MVDYLNYSFASSGCNSKCVVRILPLRPRVVTVATCRASHTEMKRSQCDFCSVEDRASATGYETTDGAKSSWKERRVVRCSTTE